MFSAAIQRWPWRRDQTAGPPAHESGGSARQDGPSEVHRRPRPSVLAVRMIEKYVDGRFATTLPVGDALWRDHLCKAFW